PPGAPSLATSNPLEVAPHVRSQRGGHRAVSAHPRSVLAAFGELAAPGPAGTTGQSVHLRAALAGAPPAAGQHPAAVRVGAELGVLGGIAARIDVHARIAGP